MDKAEQPTVTQALKPCPEVEAIAQEIADRSAWKKTTDNYARIYQAAYAGAIAAMNARTTSLAAQDGLVEALEKIPTAALYALRHRQQQADMDGTFVTISRQALEEVLDAVEAALSAIKGDKS